MLELFWLSALHLKEIPYFDLARFYAVISFLYKITTDSLETKCQALWVMVSNLKGIYIGLLTQ